MRTLLRDRHSRRRRRFVVQIRHAEREFGFVVVERYVGVVEESQDLVGHGTGRPGYRRHGLGVPSRRGFVPVVADLSASRRTRHRSLVGSGPACRLRSIGRFLSVDLIEGGCANDYAYTHGDPINSRDLTGTKDCKALSAKIRSAYQSVQKRYSDLKANKLKLPMSGKMSISGHLQQCKDTQRGLRNMLEQYRGDGCGGGPRSPYAGLPQDVWKVATRTAPTSRQGWSNSNSTRFLAVGLAFLAYLIVGVVMFIFGGGGGGFAVA